MHSQARAHKHKNHKKNVKQTNGHRRVTRPTKRAEAKTSQAQEAVTTESPHIYGPASAEDQAAVYPRMH